MKRTVNFYDFERAFKDMNRADNFSYDGLKALFEWFEEMEEGSGKETELDVIAICCDFTEFDSLEELKQSYDVNAENIEDATEELNQQTTLIRCEEDCILIQNY